MGQAEERAALAVGVTAVADPTGAKGVFYSANASATNTILTIPQVGGSPVDPTRPMRGKWINVFSSAENVQLAFSNLATGAVLVYNQAVAAGTGHAARGMTIPFGQPFPVIVPSDANFVSIITSGGTGVVEIYTSEGPG